MRLLKIGSSHDCDIVLNSRRVSALHAELIMLNNGDILLEDKGSTNGTYVNNQPIKQGASVPVRRGDLIRFADTELQWSSVPQPSNNSMFKKIYGIGSNMRYNDIQVTGNTVSRFHATLKIDKQGRAFIEDHSLNGTSINGKRIASHQNVRVKRGDDVVVGGIPVNLKPYIKPETGGIVLKTLGGLAAVAVMALIIHLILNPLGKKNPSIPVLMKATPCVIGAYYVEVTLKDDPLKELLPDLWPDTWRFGYDNKSKSWVLGGSNPHMYNGTAFFISQYGELGTNRHIAVPWAYLTNSEKTVLKLQVKTAIHDLILDDYKRNQEERQAEFQAAKAFIMVNYGVEIKQEEEDEETKYVKRIMEMLDHSDMDISGSFSYLGILLPGNTFTTSADLMACQVVAESADPDKDVAILRLNNPETPNRIVKQGYYYIENARLEETKLRISEPLQSIGYPNGLETGMNMGNGQELNPTHANASVSRKPDNNRFQMQSVSMGGQSGSPVLDADRNLVGVLCSGYRNNEITYCCNIKHLVELYNRYKWVE